MGIYIDFPDQQKTGKAERLRRDHGAEDFKGLTFADIPEGKVLVCVAENRKGEPALTIQGPLGCALSARLRISMLPLSASIKWSGTASITLTIHERFIAFCSTETSV